MGRETVRRTAPSESEAMPKTVTEMSTLTLNEIRAAAMYAVGGVVGLYLQVRESESKPSTEANNAKVQAFAKSWILRVTVGGKRRDIGLGSYPTVTLSEARIAARKLRTEIAEGVDPVQKKRDKQSALKADIASAVSFAYCAEHYIATHEAEWKSAKHRAQWPATLKTYAYPVIGQLLVRDVSTAHVRAVVEPIWQGKTETAKRTLNRIALVLDWATSAGYRSGDNPARWAGHFDALLPSPSRIQRLTRKHHPAVAIDDIGQFMETLQTVKGISAKALAFLVYTACRSGEVRGARWDEIDLSRMVWTIPATRMKAGNAHSVPLSSSALALLRQLPRKGELVFPSTNSKGQEKPLSDMALTKVMRQQKLEAVPHGMRSTFRDWVGERTSFPSDLAEMALAHKVRNATEAAYARSDLLEKRRVMMEAWAGFCSVVAVATDKNVVALKRVML
jgi:integrase